MIGFIWTLVLNVIYLYVGTAVITDKHWNPVKWEIGDRFKKDVTEFNVF
jgi:hypothetical protein